MRIRTKVIDLGRIELYLTPGEHKSWQCARCRGDLGAHRFLKKASRRTESEAWHLNQVMKDNDQFLKLELIKGRMMTFFDQPGEYQARFVIHDIVSWILQGGLEEFKIMQVCGYLNSRFIPSVKSLPCT